MFHGLFWIWVSCCPETITQSIIISHTKKPPAGQWFEFRLCILFVQSNKHNADTPSHWQYKICHDAGWRRIERSSIFVRPLIYHARWFEWRPARMSRITSDSMKRYHVQHVSRGSRGGQPEWTFGNFLKKEWWWCHILDQVPTRKKRNLLFSAN